MRTSILSAFVILSLLPAVRAADAPRPNILWLTCEDTGPHLGCYGDAYARTPNLDRLAARGMIYSTAWSNAPVCAPARTTIISGVYPTSTGAEHMRSLVPMPTSMRMYPQFLRDAGYYCTNNNKEDYNLEKPGRVWDDSSRKAHWNHRKPGQPFFAVFNYTVTHESQIRKRPHELKHDPAKVRVPAYQPDAPEVRHDWAQYYDLVTEMDGMVGRALDELAVAGLADDTIIFFYGDHGPGMPRSKRSACDSGLHVPLIVYVPPKLRQLAGKDYATGGKSDRLVSFVDLAPTLLSLIDVRPPEWMQGHAFLGPLASPEQRYVYGFRGRMDERYDLVRSVRDKRYVYVRNFMPHRPAGQHVAYMFETPTTRVWKRLYDEGKLAPPKTFFWQPKPPEELYDLQHDPDEVNNLAASASHQDVLKRMRAALREHLLATRDVGFLPEGEIHARSAGSTPYELGHNADAYPLERILGMADLASSLDPTVLPGLQTALVKGPDSAERYWAAMGILMRGKPAVAAGERELTWALRDNSPYVRIVAAEALGRFGDQSGREAALASLRELANPQKHDVYVSMFALNALGELRPLPADVIRAIKTLPAPAPAPNARMANDIPKLVESFLSDE
jgi:arylsulfatase A-like enzyme